VGLSGLVSGEGGGLYLGGGGLVVGGRGWGGGRSGGFSGVWVFGGGTFGGGFKGGGGAWLGLVLGFLVSGALGPGVIVGVGLRCPSVFGWV